MKLVDLVEKYLANTGTSVSPLAQSPAEYPPLPPSPDEWPSEWRELFEERAGIVEFEGRLTRSEAEQAAEPWIRELFRLKQKTKMIQ
jgi:hypothetical protein